MKKYFMTMTLIWGIFSVMDGQNFYQPSHTTRPYQQLQNALNLTTSNGNDFYYILSRPWMIFNTPTDDDTLMMFRNGIVESWGPQYRVSLSPCLAKLELKPNGASGIFVEEDTTIVPERLSIEWRNFGLTGNDSTDYVNFVIHIYDNQVIEFHYGPSSVTGTAGYNGNTGPGVYAIQTTLDFSTSIEMHTIGGDPANPQYFSNITSFYAVDSFPEAGTVYRFEPYNIGLPISNEIDDLNLFPNPATDIVRINDEGSLQAELYNSAGQHLGALYFQEGQADVSRLTPGVYFLKVGDSNTGHAGIQRLIIQ